MMNLNNDGSVSGQPQIVADGSTDPGSAVSRAAMRAIMTCAPYKLAAEKYDEWKQVDVTLTAD